MSVELHADEGAVRSPTAPDTTARAEPLDHGPPKSSGDLATVFQAAPMFRRAVAGYDRFQVDTYVQWAEDELTTADRERDHLTTRLLDTRAALEEARQLLSHSPRGGEFLRLSRRLGSMLATAADEAEKLTAEAEADRTAAATQAERMVADAERVLADAEARAERMIAEAATEVEERTAAAARLIDEAEHEAEHTRGEARADAEARLEKARATEQLAAEHAARIRERAVEEISAARLQARDEIARMLLTGREERRRADAEAAATRERLDRDAAARRAFLLAEIQDLERRRSVLRADLDAAAQRVAEPRGALHVRVRGLLERVQDRLEFLQVPLRSASNLSARLGPRDGQGPDA